MTNALLIVAAALVGASMVYGTDYGPGSHLPLRRRMLVGLVQAVAVLALAWAALWGPGSPMVIVVYAATTVAALLTVRVIAWVRPRPAHH